MRNKRVITIFILIALPLLGGILSSGPALADHSPHHIEVLSNVDNCAICHQTKTSAQSRLVPETSDQTTFCYSCHGRNKSGADTNVQDGVNSQGVGLRSGGFERATMDPGLNGTPTSKPVTSAHSIDNSPVISWGGGEINGIPDYGNVMTMECSDCHNPHGNGNYRMLRGLPKGMYNGDNTVPVEVPDESQVNYTITYDVTSGYRDNSYVPANLDQWCAQCHSRYSAGTEAGQNHSGDAVFSFRHTTDSLPGGCAQCHVAHGTTATMTGAASFVELPDGTPAGGSSDSRLLHTDNRGDCLKCHSSASLTAN